MAVIVAVIVRCLALVPPGRTCSEPVVALALLIHVRLAGPLQPDDDVLVVPGVDLVADLDLREPLDVRPGDDRHEGAIRFLERDRAARGFDRLDDARLRSHLRLDGPGLGHGRARHRHQNYRCNDSYDKPFHTSSWSRLDRARRHTRAVQTACRARRKYNGQIH